MAITDQSAATSNNQTQHSDSKRFVQNHSPSTNMDPAPLDFDECLKDSPKFRQSLKDHLAYVENLESCMSKTIKQVANYIETGRDHIKAQKDFLASMKNLNGMLVNGDNETSKQVDILLETLGEFMRLYEIVIDQSARTVGNSMSKFINDDLFKLKEARKSFDKISHEHDLALSKYSQPIKKQQEDSENLLIATSTAFTHTSLDLSIQLTTLQSKKGYEILNSLLSFTKAHSTFFHQGSDLFEDLKPHISDMDEFLSKIQDEFEVLIRNLPSKHLMVSNNELRPLSFDNSSEQVHLEGYLFKRASNGFKVWNRRWFILKDHQLLYQKRGDFSQPITMEEDIRLLTVRPADKADIDRRFCFEILSPQKSHILQADSDAACKTWISAIQAGINAAYHDTEHKARPPRPAAGVANELHNTPAPSTSSWSSSFSFKALQQQASSRLNSITTTAIGEPKQEQQLSKSKDKLKLSKQRRSEQQSIVDEPDAEFKVDEEGRSYAPLKYDEDDGDDGNSLEDDDDDDDEGGGHDVHDERRDKQKQSSGGDIHSVSRVASYPKAAPIPPPNLERGAPEKPQRAYMIILAVPGNDTCADCGAAQPRWASINLGITLCIECAGIHRSLGVHLSKVRSLTLDTEVWSPEIVQLMLSLGNSSVNGAYLACYRGKQPPVEPDCSREERESWIKSKYLLKNFMRLPGQNSSFTEPDPPLPGRDVGENKKSDSPDRIGEIREDQSTSVTAAIPTDKQPQ